MNALYVGTDMVRILISSDQTGGALALCEVAVTPGGGPPMHVHGREDETFHVLEGEITVWVDGRQHVARAGDTLFGPRGIPHRFQNCTDRPARMLVAMTPGGFEGYFREVGVPAIPGAPAPALGPEVIARFMAHADRYGITFVA
ncbi:MAG: cupin domain-containing protein [Acetobacteraceae bacterium]|jgi:quercetin dioxygenase-like cupin family protein|nr:cupin domain-containing protein [Acetobacteraceae bacterium]